MNKTITTSWKSILSKAFEQAYFKEIENFIAQEKAKGKIIYPQEDLVFKAFNLFNYEQTKVIIIGQDPYHGKNQAEGLSFSVPKGVKIPPSLKNIFKELQNDLQIDMPTHGHLISWAEQGVLLLNAILTVNAKEPASHKKAGWEIFTNNIIKAISTKNDGLVFLLWGNFAQEKEALIDTKKHLVLKAAHPSPFSAHKGFFGSKPFSKTNAYLIQKDKSPILWELPKDTKQAKLF